MCLITENYVYVISDFEKKFLEALEVKWLAFLNNKKKWQLHHIDYPNRQWNPILLWKFSWFYYILLSRGNWKWLMFVQAFVLNTLCMYILVEQINFHQRGLAVRVQAGELWLIDDFYYTLPVHMHTDKFKVRNWNI